MNWFVAERVVVIAWLECRAECRGMALGRSIPVYCGTGVRKRGNKAGIVGRWQSVVACIEIIEHQSNYLCFVLYKVDRFILRFLFQISDGRLARLETHTLPNLTARVKNSLLGHIMALCTLHFLSSQLMVKSEWSPDVRRLEYC